jgi:nucleoside-diphosphate-sugar epimerase
MPHLFVFGYGYSAGALGDRLRARGWRVSGTTRSAEKRVALADAGITAHDFPLTDESVLDGVSHVLVSTPPGGNGDPVLAHHAPAIAARAGTIEWLGYLSTTGVYGDHQGAWVDEASALRATSPRARARIEAETAWFALGREAGIPVMAFRLAGIYGPGRNPLERARRGEARRIHKEGVFFSRIHVEDIAAVLAASMARPRAGAAYNVCDDEPAPAAEVTAFACGLLGIAPPPLVPFAEAEAAMSEMAKSFWADSRRVRNKLIRDELDVQLAYPTYREGLRALLRG